MGGQPEVVDLHDVAVVQARRDPRFVQKHPPHGLVGVVLGQDAFDRDPPLEPIVAMRDRLGHHRHAAGCDGSHELVSAQSGHAAA